MSNEFSEERRVSVPPYVDLDNQPTPPYIGELLPDSKKREARDIGLRNIERRGETFAVAQELGYTWTETDELDKHGLPIYAFYDINGTELFRGVPEAQEVQLVLRYAIEPDQQGDNDMPSATAFEQSLITDIPAPTSYILPAEQVAPGPLQNFTPEGRVPYFETLPDLTEISDEMAAQRGWQALFVNLAEVKEEFVLSEKETLPEAIMPETPSRIAYEDLAYRSVTRARHAARPEHLKKWGRRLAAGAMAASALFSSFFSPASHSVQQTEHKPTPVSSAPENPVQPPITKPQPTSSITKTVTEAGGVFTLTETANGQITAISGELTATSNPWELTAEALALNGETATSQNITEADPYMQNAQTQHRAQKLVSGTAIRWTVRTTAGKPQLRPQTLPFQG